MNQKSKKKPEDIVFYNNYKKEEEILLSYNRESGILRFNRDKSGSGAE